jgi:hypothetical protein
VTTRSSTTAGLPRCIVCGEVIKLSVILAGEALRRFRGEAVEWRHERCAEVLVEALDIHGRDDERRPVRGERDIRPGEGLRRREGTPGRDPWPRRFPVLSRAIASIATTSAARLGLHHDDRAGGPAYERDCRDRWSRSLASATS